MTNKNKSSKLFKKTQSFSFFPAVIIEQKLPYDMSGLKFDMLAMLFAFINDKNSSKITFQVSIWKFDIGFVVATKPKKFKLFGGNELNYQN